MKRTSLFGALAILVLLIVRRWTHGQTPPAPKLGKPKAEPMIEVLEPLTTKVLVERSIETFPSGYLNNISIIQGVAVGSLLDRTFTAWKPTDTAFDHAMLLGEATYLLLGIIVVLYEYLWFLTVVRWTPTFRDTLVPLTLGVSEIIPQFFLGTSTAWWISVSVFTAMGTLAFYNTVSRLKPNLFADHGGPYKKIRRVLWQLIGCCASLTVAELIMWRFSPRVIHTFIAPAVMWLLVASTAIVILLSEHALDGVYADFGIYRRPHTKYKYSK